MSKFCVEVADDLIVEFPTSVAELGWTVIAQLPSSSSRNTFVEIDAPSAPAEIDGWLCSPTVGRRDDGTLFVMGYGPLTDLTREQRAVIAAPGT